ncbi:EscU/YscU/HrcU family type III secretion system export apparatus switch protein, partial [Vibrio cholerae]|nr:EscU/YscU/HrcU family type III secretion system export apparatus switch protein [Vibrio cholerae]
MSGDKSEKPTGQRLDKARKEGNLPRSRELVTALLVLGGTIT